MEDVIILNHLFSLMLFTSRKYEIKTEDRQFLDYIPPASILLGGIIFLVGTVAAILTYQTPNGGYHFLDQFFSELGIRHDYIETLAGGSTEQRYAPPYPDLFNITLYASGFLMIPFFLFSYRQMRNSNRLSNLFLIIATMSGVLAGPMLIGVGIFDLSYPSHDIFWQEHGFWVASLYLLLTVTAISWFLMLVLSSKLPYHTSKWIGLDYLFLIVLVIMVIVNLLDGLKIVMVGDIPLLNNFPIETYQKLIAYVFFAYYGLVVGVRLTKTKYDNTPVISERPKPISQEINLFCTKCGTENPSGSEFCVDCGVKLK